MDQRVVSRIPKANLRVSVDERSKGLKDLDFIADHTCLDNLMQFSASRPVADMGPLYLRCALTSMACPDCGAEVKRSYRTRPLEWLLKFAGRKLFYCTNCNWHQIVKVGRWEWQTVLTVLAAFTIVCAASIHWILR